MSTFAAAAAPVRSRALAWSISEGDRLLAVSFPRPMQVTSWAVWNGGRRTAAAVVWVGVRNAELPIGLDPRQLCADRLQAAGLPEAVGLMTSGRLDRSSGAEASTEGVAARTLATVGLSNAVRVGDPPGPLVPVGTINILCAVSQPLSEPAALEALSLVVEARTAAVVEAEVRSRRSAGLATGTGTDCVVLAWPEADGPPAAFAGKHTALGHVIGRAAGDCVRAGLRDWQARQC